MGEADGTGAEDVAFLNRVANSRQIIGVLYCARCGTEFRHKRMAGERCPGCDALIQPNKRLEFLSQAQLLCDEAILSAEELFLWIDGREVNAQRCDWAEEALEYLYRQRVTIRSAIQIYMRGEDDYYG